MTRVNISNYRGSPNYSFFNTAETQYHGFWLMNPQVGDFHVSRGSPTVPITQNPRNVRIDKQAICSAVFHSFFM